jgi:carboxylesterase type B
VAEDLGRKLGLNFNSSQSLIEQLRKVDPTRIRQAEKVPYFIDNPESNVNFDYMPTIEPEDSLEERLLTANPMEILQSGNFSEVPIMIGSTNNEGLIMIPIVHYWTHVLDALNQRDDLFLHTFFDFKNGSSEMKEAAKVLRKFYFSGDNMTLSRLDLYAKYQTDAMFKITIDQTVKILAQKSSQPIYYYEFAYSGAYNYYKYYYQLWRYEGACHVDDSFYLFIPNTHIPVWPTSPALTVRSRYIRMFTHFAKFG